MLSYLQISILTEKKKQLKRELTAKTELHQESTQDLLITSERKMDGHHAIHVERQIASVGKSVLLHTRLHCPRSLSIEVPLFAIMIRSTHKCQALDSIFNQ